MTELNQEDIIHRDCGGKVIIHPTTIYGDEGAEATCEKCKKTTDIY